MAQIRILDEEVARKIAAGEVIERPASVVKELVENALDAQASKIEIYLERGGQRLIKVRDNGHGMSMEDLSVCYLPHATSKIRRPEDLLAIHTLGFRGEALASIAAVSRLVITSRPQQDLLGARLEVRFGRQRELREIGAPKGTVVEVYDLFANVPARLAFLKTPRTESLKVLEIVRLLSLGFAEVAFLLETEKRVLFRHDPRQGRRGLLASLCGLSPEDIREEVLERPPYKLELFLADPQKKFPTARHLYFLVNRRVVRDRILSGALLQGAALAFARGQYPVALLALEMPPELVDVNVHPAKWEVRFREEGKIYSLVREVVENALKPKITLPISPPEECEEDIPLSVPKEPKKGSGDAGLYERPLAFEGDSAISLKIEETEEAQASYSSKTRVRPLGILTRKYYLFEHPQGLLVLDYHAAHERLLFENIRKAYTQKGLSSQRLLWPVVKRLSAQALERLETHQEVLRQLGYEIVSAGPEEIRILSVPALVGDSAVEALIQLLEEDLLAPAGKILHRVFATLACRAAIKAGEDLSEEEARRLWEEIEAQGFFSCPHGRPLYWLITHEELERRLGRRV